MRVRVTRRLFAACMCALLSGGMLVATTETANAAPPFGAVISAQQMKLLASDATGGERLGYTVAVSGDTAVIGAESREAAYVYVRSGAAWTQQQILMASDSDFGLFGTTVAVDGDTALIGAPFADGTLGAGSDQGAAYVFTRSGTNWTEQQKLLAADAGVQDFFGIAVALDGDTALITAPRDDLDNFDEGSAYVFTRSGTTWAQQQKLTATPLETNTSFGNSGAIDGNTIVIGAQYAGVSGQGAAYVFTRSGTTWTQQQRLTANDAGTQDYFGVSVAVEGDTALVGEPLENNVTGSGSVYAFTRSGTTWTQQQKLTPADGAAGDQFGYGVALAGDTAILGAPSDDAAGGTNHGSAYVFTRSGSTWTQQNKLVPSDADAADQFGFSTALSGDTVVIGAPGDDDTAGSNQGSAYVFVPGSFSVSDATVTEGTGGTKNATFTVSRSGTLAQSAYVNVDTVAGSATAGTDFDAVTTTLSFAPGLATTTVVVPIATDARDEDDETFRVVLSSPTGALIGDGSGSGVIVDDDEPSSLTIAAPAPVTETDAGQVAVNFTVSRSGSSGGAVTVEARSANGTATAPDDFDNVVRTIRWANGETGNKTFTVMVDPDNITEDVERFYAKLGKVTGPAEITVGSARATINDDDAPTVTISVNSPTILEADSGTKNIVFKVTRTGSTASAITFNFATANGTATAPGDYTAKTGTATIAAGATFVNVTVVTKGDTVPEPNEAFTLTISSPTGGATLGTATGTGTLTNED